MSVITATPKTKLITGEELLAMGDIGPCELIDGRIVYVSPTGGEHGGIEFKLGRQLANFVAEHKLGWVMGGEVGIYTRRNPDRVRGADVVFISKQRITRRPKGFLEVAPELVVEVVSPDDRWKDIREKLEEYFAIGVEWVWIVEPESRTVLVYRLIDQPRLSGRENRRLDNARFSYIILSPRAIRTTSCPPKPQ